MKHVVDPRGTPLRGNQWWACEYPERPAELGPTRFGFGCRACTIALGVLVAENPQQTGWGNAEQTELITVEEALRHRLDDLGMTLPRSAPIGVAS